MQDTKLQGLTVTVNVRLKWYCIICSHIFIAANISYYSNNG